MTEWIFIDYDAEMRVSIKIPVLPDITMEDKENAARAKFYRKIREIEKSYEAT